MPLIAPQAQINEMLIFTSKGHETRERKTPCFFYKFLMTESYPWFMVNNLLGKQITLQLRYTGLVAGPRLAVFVELNGRKVLMIGNNRFMKHYISRQGRTRWRCCKSFNKCRAIAITHGSYIMKLNDQHNHWGNETIKDDKETKT